MEKGACIISIDYEYAWGVADHKLSSKDLERIRGEAHITERLYTLFERYRIPATWAIVGKLLEPRPDNDAAWTDAGRLINRIRTSSAGHEVGSHSYAHILYPDVPEEEAKTDIGNAKLLHEQHNLPFRSFVFPRNRGGHHKVLRDAGLSVFRGTSRQWYRFLPYILWPLGRGIDYWLPTARTIVPSWHESGLLDVPDSILLVSRKGAQKLLPPSQTVRKIVWGLAAAVRRKEIFHLWFHPSNFSHDTETQLRIFENILVEVARLRDEDKLQVLTMGECEERYGQL